MINKSNLFGGILNFLKTIFGSSNIEPIIIENFSIELVTDAGLKWLRSDELYQLGAVKQVFTKSGEILAMISDAKAGTDSTEIREEYDNLAINFKESTTLGDDIVIIAQNQEGKVVAMTFISAKDRNHCVDDARDHIFAIDGEGNILYNSQRIE